MNKKDLIDGVAAATGLTGKQSADAVDSMLTAIKAYLKKGEKLSLTGFGAFSVSKRKARVGRNPRTGEEIRIEASRSPKFTPSKALKELLNK